MIALRPTMVAGMVMVFAFLLVVVATSVFLPDQVQSSRYHLIKEYRLQENLADFEGKDITVAVTVKSIIGENSTFYFVRSQGETLFLCPAIIGLSINERVLVRGKSQILSKGYFLVHETHVFRSEIVYILSGLGAFIFAALWFAVFRFDPKRLAFVPRRDKHA